MLGKLLSASFSLIELVELELCAARKTASRYFQGAVVVSAFSVIALVGFLMLLAGLVLILGDVIGLSFSLLVLGLVVLGLALIVVKVVWEKMMT